MIERFYLKDYLSFKETELNLRTALVVFIRPNGSGKSILSSLGGGTCDTAFCESSVAWDIAQKRTITIK